MNFKIIKGIKLKNNSNKRNIHLNSKNVTSLLGVDPKVNQIIYVRSCV